MGANALAFKIVRDLLLSPNEGAKRADCTEVMRLIEQAPSFPQGNGESSIRYVDLPNSLLATLGISQAAATQHSFPSSDAARRVGTHVSSLLEPLYYAKDELSGDPSLNGYVSSDSHFSIQGRTNFGVRHRDGTLGIRLPAEALWHPRYIVRDPTFQQLQEPALREEIANHLNELFERVQNDQNC